MRGVVTPAIISALINCLGACSSAQTDLEAQRHFDGPVPKTAAPLTVSNGRFGLSSNRISSSRFGAAARDANADDRAVSSAAYGNEIDPIAKATAARGKAKKTPAVPSLKSRHAPLGGASSPAVPSSVSPIIAIVTYPFQHGEAEPAVDQKR